MKTLALTTVAAVGLAAAATALGAARPSTPKVAGPTQTTPGKHTYVFSSREKGVPGSKLRFRCSLDSSSLHGCARRLTVDLAAGTHVLRAQAVDPAGHRSPTARISIAVHAPPASVPELAVQQVWKVQVTGTAASEQYSSIAIGPDSNLYIPDTQGNQIKVYNPAGTLLRTWGSPGVGPGQFHFNGLASEPPSLGGAGIAVDPSGSVYVADPGNARIDKFDPSGNFLLQWGTAGTDNGQFGRVIDVAVGQGKVYTLEDRPDRLGRVQVFDAAGAFLTTFGRGQIIDSGGFTVDSAGQVYVGDDLANNIKVFGPSGQLLRTLGEPGNAPGELDFPTGLGLDGAALFVSDTTHERIVRFDIASGQPTGYWSLDTPPVWVTADGAGNVYVADVIGGLTKYRLPS